MVLVSDHETIFFGFSCITTLVPGGINAVTLKFNSSTMLVKAYILGFSIGISIVFNLIISRSTSVSQYCGINLGSTLQSLRITYACNI